MHLLSRTALAIGFLVSGVGVASAQFTANFLTNTIDGLTSNWVGNYHIGSNTTFNVLQVINGGVLTNQFGFMGYEVSGSNAFALVDGNGSAWINTTNLTVGRSGRAELVITNGGKVVNSVSTVGGSGGGGNVAASGSRVLVSGNGSLWTNAGSVSVGYLAPAQVHVNNGGRVISSQLNIGLTYSSLPGSNSVVTVSGSGSVWTNTGGVSVGYSAPNTQLVITNGGRMAANSLVYFGGGGGVAGSNTLVLISGSNSVFSGGNMFFFGNSSSFNTLTINDGGLLSAQNQIRVSTVSSGSSNTVNVSDPGSVLTTPNSLNVGELGSENRLFISNAGQVTAATVNVGSSGSASNNRVRITSQGVLEANTLTIGGTNGSITNFGGVFQFSTSAPTITPGATIGGSIVLTNGTISFRGIANAPLTALGGITYQGDNAFRLNRATNATVTSYTFDTGLGADHYTRLELLNGGTAWRSSALTIGSHGVLLVSNAAATVEGVLTNWGSVRVVNSQVTYKGPVVLGGTYASDPSTNTFGSNLTVTASGALQGGNGDVFVFQQSLFLETTNRSQFDLSSAAMRFTNASGGPTNHVLDLSGSGALDLGSNWLNVVQLATNFSLGRLEIGLGNSVQITGATTNAFYVGVLDLAGLGTNALPALLDLDVNVYYDATAVGNAYLEGKTYDFSQWNGALIPLTVIPEPSVAMLVAAPLVAWALVGRKKTRTKNSC